MSPAMFLGVPAKLLAISVLLTGCRATWSQFHGDLRNTGFIDVHSTSVLSEKWRIPVGEVGYGSPVIGPDGAIYVGNFAAQLIAVNPSDGSVLWQWDGALKHGENYIASSPAVDADGNVFVVAMSLGFDLHTGLHRGVSTVYKIDKSGHEIWLTLLGEQGFTTSSPKVWGRAGTQKLFIYFHSRVGERQLLVLNSRGGIIHREPLNCTPPEDQFSNPRGPEEHAVGDWPAFDPYKVNALLYAWPDPTPAVIDSKELGLSANPIIIVADHSCSVQALRWNPPTADDEAPSMNRLWQDFDGADKFTSPAVGSDGTTIIGRGDDHVVGYDIDGKRIWDIDFVANNDVAASPILMLGSAVFPFVASRDRLYRLSATGGAMNEIGLTYDALSSPAMTWDRIYMGTKSGMMSLSLMLDDVYQDRTAVVYRSSPAIGPDGSIYVVTTDGYLVGYRSPNELSRL